MSLVPAIAFYNVGNFSNFKDYSNGTLANVNTEGGDPNNILGLVNGPATFAGHDQNRIQRGSGTSDIGGPRTAEFQLKLNF
ncbi:hypothetical protein RBB78_03450 [Tunturiibacter empetritectus]